uniref:Uncharacterized protein n=1 Tax=Tetradesmus obliquus TaxID=3088 RepID=A0A383VBQ2_TETOB
MHCCSYAGLAVVHTAERVVSAAVGSSSGSKKQAGKPQQQQQAWLPILLAAHAALPAVLVHSEGVEKTAHLLLREFEEWQAQQPAAATAAAAGRKQQKGPRQASAAAAAPAGVSVSMSAADLPPLLALPALNSFFAAAVDVARAARDDDEEAAAAAAAAAVTLAEAVYARQLLQVKAGINSSMGSEQPLAPDAQTYALLAQVYAAAGQYKTVSSIVMAAVRHQLPLPAPPSSSNSSSSRSEALQAVLSGAAAAWLAAGHAAVVPLLLDGLAAAGGRQLSHPGLAAAVLQAANDDLEGIAARLAGGEDAVFGDEE